ncbi:hypothetical protein CJ179_21130 [Rhodococcus sp. ACS1]|nr:hypothetical protein CJ179_21130 [Rhodococcus sp. ACS1]
MGTRLTPAFGESFSGIYPISLVHPAQQLGSRSDSRNGKFGHPKKGWHGDTECRENSSER